MIQSNTLTSFNSTVTLMCFAGGGPNNIFVWRKQGTVVSNSSTLELSMITGSDGGTYECTVANGAGSATTSAELIGV